MADKAIGELPEASALYSDSLLVVEQQSEARSIRGELVAKFARESAAADVQRAADAADAAERSAGTAAAAAEKAAAEAGHPPILKEESGHWWIWDREAGEYADSGIDACVSLTVVEAVTGEPGTAAKVENLGTPTDPVLQFTIPVGADGKMGFSPTVEITKEGKDNIITITAEDGPHTFTVRDGEASIPDNLIVGEDSDVPGEIVADADTLEGHPAEYFATKEEVTAGLSEKQDMLTFDEAPTADSANPVKSGGVYSALQKKSGENLLINSDFRNPINQWGQPLYTGNGATIDMWRTWSSTTNQSLSVMDGFVRYTPGTSTGNFTQKVDGKSRNLVAGTVATFSVLIASGEIEICSGELSDSEDIIHSSTAWNGDIQISKIADNTGVVTVVFNIRSGTVLDLVACKLELGSEQTLAHKEGDTWVLNDPPPDPAVELAKCQRYQYVLSGYLQPIGMFISTEAGRARIFINLPKMRVKPTVQLTGTARLVAANSSVGYHSEVNFDAAKLSQSSSIGSQGCYALDVVGLDSSIITMGSHGWCDIADDVTKIVFDANL